MSLISFGVQDLMLTTSHPMLTTRSLVTDFTPLSLKQQRKLEKKRIKLEREQKLKEALQKAKQKAYDLVSKLRLIILAKRRLTRLRLCREIEHIPGIGIKYLESLDHFSQLHTNQSSPSIPL